MKVGAEASCYGDRTASATTRASTGERVTAVGALEPSLSMPATIWVTRQGWYWRSEDGGALVRYHGWAANHTRLPTPALHSQVMTVWAGHVLHSRRDLRVTPIPITRRYWWIDAWRSHRDQPAPLNDQSVPEREAGLVFISHTELQAAGLRVLIEEQGAPATRRR